tara:strand:- start:164 stop:388 length:225 start_codon:yes stop_codon:yes gene_type:complete
VLKPAAEFKIIACNSLTVSISVAFPAIHPVQSNPANQSPSSQFFTCILLRSQVQDVAFSGAENCTDSGVENEEI